MKKNYFKKSLAILLALMMVMGSLIAIPLTASADDDVAEGDAPAASKWIEVGTLDDLKALRSAINAYEGEIAFIRLTADIEVGEHTPINGTNKPVYFDGQNHKLINMTIGSEKERAGNTGLFQSVQPGSTIMNVHFVGAKVYSGKSQGGGILLNDQKNGITVVNVSTDETSLINHDSNRVGGLIARIYGGDPHAHTYIGYCVNAATVINCTTVKDKGDAAGILGATYGTYNITFDHCVNKGPISSTGFTPTGQTAVAGISGRFERAQTTTNHVTGTTYTFVDCYNVGTLSAIGCVNADTQELQVAGNLHMAGVSGVMQGFNPAPASGPATKLVVERCYDYSARVNTATNDGNRGVSTWTDGGQMVKYIKDCYAANAAASTNPYTKIHGWNNEIKYVALEENTGVIVPAEGDTNPLDDKIVLSTGETTLEAEMARIDAEFANIYVGMNEYVPYYISNMDDWAAFCALPIPANADDPLARDYYVELKCDLDLSAAPHAPIQVCKYTKLVFNGNGHIITGLNVGTADARTGNAALFYRVGYNSEIHDLHFVGAKIFGSGQMTAVVINDAYAGLKMTNVSVDSTSLVSGSGNHTGGLVGRIYKGDNTMVNVFENCVNGASVTGPTNVAGFVGNMNGNYTLSFKNCINTGALTTTAASGNIAVAGLLGMHDRGATNPNFAISFENCVNTGALTLAPAEGTTASVWAGGIFGSLRGNNPEGGTVLTVKNCFDYSKRDLSKALSGKYTAIGALGGNADNAQMNKYLNGNAAANVSGSATSYDKVWGFTISNTIIEDNYNTVAASATAEITLAEGVTSTIEAEINAINNAVVATQIGLGAAGTEADPFVITKPAQLAAINQFVKGFKGMTVYMTLGADLDLKDVAYVPFDSTLPVVFDGAGKTIKNMTVVGNKAGQDGFFKNLPNGSTVKNVTFLNASVTNSRFAGIVAGASQANVTVENVHVTGVVSADGHVAAIIGGTAGEKANTGAYTFKNIVANVELIAPETSTSNAAVGGMIGMIAKGATTVTFENCVVLGTMRYEVSGSTHNNKVMGGMVGKTTYDAANNVEAIFRNCVNMANMSSTGAAMHVGGLVGWLHFDKLATVENCYVTGTQSIVYNDGNNGYFKGMIANSPDAELAANIINSYAIKQIIDGAVNKNFDNENLMKRRDLSETVTTGIKTFTTSGLVDDAIAEITLTTATGTDKSTIQDEVAKILDLACVAGHAFAADCDLTCNICSQTREPIANSAHEAEADCSEVCKLCGEIFREVNPFLHTPENACDIDCNICGKILDVVPHALAKACSETCPDCGETLTPTAAHTFGGDCDTECDVCGQEREATAEHTYDNACDADCNACGFERTPADHVYDNDCDAKCNVCEEERTPADHVYDNDCDAKCNVCEGERTPADHVYDDDADATCNVCGAERTIVTPNDPTPNDPTDDPADDNKPEDDKKDDDTTKAPDTTEAPAGGCGGSIAGVGALLALTATFGFAFVGKKKED